MHHICMVLCLLLLAQPDKTYPAEVTENDIQKFTKGIEELMSTSHNMLFEDKTFDPLNYDEQAAIESAETYDFIIVGAGATGSVVANRLSEIQEWKILLLEAGGTETPYMQVPAISGVLQGTPYSWGYVTEPQESWCLGMINNTCSLPTGKGLGGGTIINSMAYTRGNARDYDLWAEQGNDGWSYKNVLPYFKKAEDCALPKFDKRYHGEGGPLYVEENQFSYPLMDTFLSAGKELGYDIIDYTGREQLGFSKLQTTTKHGKRNSAAKSYLFPYQDRRNLHIKPMSHVIQVVIDPYTKATSGVKYIRNERMYIAKAKKEVIISAGAFNSPQLLMLSGIGPKEDLEKLEIPVIQHLQIGKKLKDHLSFIGPTFFVNTSKFEEGNLHDNVENWLKNGKGPLAAVPAIGIAYITTNINKDSSYPDIEIILGNTGFANVLRLKEEYRSVLEPTREFGAFRMGIMPTHPLSVGSVKLKSKDPFHGPVIDSNQFNDPDNKDIETMLAGIRKAIEIAKAADFQKIGTVVDSEPVKGCEHFEFNSDDYWKCAARHLSVSLRHQTGTCRMGPRCDKFAVVDNKLRVYGIRNLRVADCSIVPVDITGHTHAVANMVGEKAADLIKEHWL